MKKKIGYIIITLLIGVNIVSTGVLNGNVIQNGAGHYKPTNMTQIIDPKPDL